MGVYSIFFSPTGGTRRVAEILTSALADKWSCVDMTKADFAGQDYSFTDADICVIAVPSFGGRVPGPAVERISRMKGNGARAVLVCVYGNREYEDTLAELKAAAEGAGFLCPAAVAAIAEHSVVRSVAAGRPDEEDQGQLKAFGAAIRAKLEVGEVSSAVVPGNLPEPKKGGPHGYPQAGDDCISCGLCVPYCPVGAISPDSPCETDGAKCISCMACVEVCPTRARALPSQMMQFLTEKLSACTARKENELFL